MFSRSFSHENEAILPQNTSFPRMGKTTQKTRYLYEVVPIYIRNNK